MSQKHFFPYVGVTFWSHSLKSSDFRIQSQRFLNAQVTDTEYRLNNTCSSHESSFMSLFGNNNNGGMFGSFGNNNNKGSLFGGGNNSFGNNNNTGFGGGSNTWKSIYLSLYFFVWLLDSLFGNKNNNNNNNNSSSNLNFLAMFSCVEKASIKL